MLLRRHKRKNVTTLEDVTPKTEEVNLEELSKTKLKELAKEAKIEGYTKMEQEDLIKALRGE